MIMRGTYHSAETLGKSERVSPMLRVLLQISAVVEHQFLLRQTWQLAVWVSNFSIKETQTDNLACFLMKPMTLRYPEGSVQ